MSLHAITPSNFDLTKVYIILESERRNATRSISYAGILYGVITKLSKEFIMKRAAMNV